MVYIRVTLIRASEIIRTVVRKIQDVIRISEPKVVHRRDRHMGKTSRISGGDLRQRRGGGGMIGMEG